MYSFKVVPLAFTVIIVALFLSNIGVALL